MTAKIKQGIAASIEHASQIASKRVEDRAVSFTCHLAGYVRKDCPDLADALCALMEIESATRRHAAEQPISEAAC